MVSAGRPAVEKTDLFTQLASFGGEGNVAEQMSPPLPPPVLSASPKSGSLRRRNEKRLVAQWGRSKDE